MNQLTLDSSLVPLDMELGDDRHEIRALELLWECAPHDEILFVEKGRSRTFYVIFEAIPWRVFVSVRVGTRMGLKEKTVAIDPTSKPSERLVRAGVFGATPFGLDVVGLLDLRQMKCRMTAESAAEICGDCLTKIVELGKSNPTAIKSRVQGMDKRSESIFTIAAGAPGLGK